MLINQSHQDILNRIQAALGVAITPSLTASSAGNDLFEAYVFSLIVEAATEEGASVTFEGVTGGISSIFTFRTSPGYISSTAHDYSHAVIAFPNKPPLEAHVGIYVAGKSGVLHECDVAVVDRAEAQACRANQVSPRSVKVLMAAECKFYTSTPDLGLGRGFLGLNSDLSKECFFVMNISSRSIERLLSQRLKHRCREQVVPANAGAVSLLFHSFRSTFHEYRR